jgi:predicted transcriptional regulator
MPALNALKAFEVAGRTGSFTRAAELLNVTQSAVSRQVRQLEAQLGETLLQRHHHHLELSAASSCKHCNSHLTASNSRSAACRRKPTATVCVSTRRPPSRAAG